MYLLCNLSEQDCLDQVLSKALQLKYLTSFVQALHAQRLYAMRPRNWRCMHLARRRRRQQRRPSSSSSNRVTADALPAAAPAAAATATVTIAVISSNSVVLMTPLLLSGCMHRASLTAAALPAAAGKVTQRCL
jgi:hypothetical protein